MELTQNTSKMLTITAAIKEGAMAFLGREYRTLFIFVLVIGVILGVIPVLGWLVAITFAFGAVCSGLAGFIGMNIAIRSNGRTASATAQSLNKGLKVAFRSGTVMGLCVVSIGILGLSILYFCFGGRADFLTIIPAYGFGASLVAIFARVGGGIFTKAADTGADLVGKVEQGIPEDDPRNAAVIADFVGDNVGDVAGMGADLFESYVDSIIATMSLGILAAVSAPLGRALVPDEAAALWLPMLIAAGGIIASIIGIFVVRVGEIPKMEKLLAALRRGTITSSVLAAGISLLVVWLLKADIGIFWAILAGLLAGVLIGESTNYFTSYAYSPTRRISDSAETGSATTIISGFSTGLMSALPPIVLIAIAVLVAHHFAGIYGVAIAGVGMLATLGITLATDAYGPVADNAGGIAEMSGLPHEVREKTDALDSLGNTTAATGKGFAIGSAGLTALALMLSYTQAVGLDFSAISLLDVNVFVGVVLGAVLPVVFCALTLNGVGKTSNSIINEVRRQFREIAGLMDGEAQPKYGKCVDICTKAALKQMIVPGIVTVATPIAIGLVLGPLALGGFLLGAIVCGLVLAIVFCNAGGAWDNAKKWIEAGHNGGSNSAAHKAAVVGDTVGDPMKDTAGPSLNIMIKLIAIIALVFAPLFAQFPGLF